MTSPVTWENRDGIALITIDSPPVNALGHAVRAGLWEAVEAAEADPAVRALVITAAGRSFPAGADIREFGKPPQAPLLPDLCDRIEVCTKPVIAALHGTALGGGLELALAAHVRIAHAKARVGFPEINLGLLPGAGGTQRAPRLIGAEQALQLMTGGRPVRAADALAMGLLDGVVEDGLTEAALALAADLVADGTAPVPTRDRTEGFRNPQVYAEAIAAARRQPHPPEQPAATRIADCVEAALLLPFEAGLAYERAAFEELQATPAARGLRHAFLSERRLSKTPEAGTEARPVEHLGVIGGGRTGAALVLSALSAGLKVTLVERDHDALIAALERIADIHEAEVARGRLTPEKRDDDWARLAGSAELPRLAEAEMIVEAVPEDLGLKAEIFSQLGRVARPGAILASATAALDIAVLATAAERPADTLAFRPWTEIPRSGLVELGVTPRTGAEAVATATALAARLGHRVVRATGPLLGRMMGAWAAAADGLLLAGSTPLRIDTALRGYGYRRGRYQAEDLIGLATLSGLRRPGLADGLAERGRTGCAVGAGWFDWPEGTRRAQENDEVLALVEAERKRHGLPPRPVGEEEIVLSCLLALIAEGTRVLADETALRPSDIDMALMIGLGFPRWRGGPMLAADMMGLLDAKNALAALAPENPELWTPADLLADLLKNGRSFEDLNGI